MSSTWCFISSSTFLTAALAPPLGTFNHVVLAISSDNTVSGGPLYIQLTCQFDVIFITFMCLYDGMLRCFRNLLIRYYSSKKSVVSHLLLLCSIWFTLNEDYLFEIRYVSFELRYWVILSQLNWVCRICFHYMSHRWQTWLLCRIWTVSLLYLCTFEVVMSHMRCLCWISICKSYIWPEKAIADKKVWLQVMHSHLCVCVCACHRKIMIFVGRYNY